MLCIVQVNATATLFSTTTWHGSSSIFSIVSIFQTYSLYYLKLTCTVYACWWLAYRISNHGEAESNWRTAANRDLDRIMPPASTGACNGYVNRYLHLQGPRCHMMLLPGLGSRVAGVQERRGGCY